MRLLAFFAFIGQLFKRKNEVVRKNFSERNAQCRQDAYAWRRRHASRRRR